MSFQDKPSTKKGNYGEKLVYDFLKSKDCILYKTDVDRAHEVDFIVFPKNNNAYFCEIKTTHIQRNLLDGEKVTGWVFKKHYDRYLDLVKKYNMPLYIFFVDELEGEIYGSSLGKLEKIKTNKLPWHDYDTVHFYKKYLTKYSDINKGDIEILLNLKDNIVS